MNDVDISTAFILSFLKTIIKIKYTAKNAIVNITLPDIVLKAVICSIVLFAAYSVGQFYMLHLPLY